jgi:hypothetical protein
MGYYLMPVRAEHDDPVDDWVVWSTYSDAPVARGTRAEVTTWWREMFGSTGVESLENTTAFVRADVHGSSAESGSGRWGTTITVHGFGLLGPGQFDRDKLPAYVDAIFSEDHRESEAHERRYIEVGRKVRALVTPFDPAEDPEIDVEVWKIQAEQAIADFEGAYDRDPDLA